MDMRRMQGVLTEEQSRKISDFKVLQFLSFPDDGHATDAGSVDGGAIASNFRVKTERREGRGRQEQN